MNPVAVVRTTVKSGDQGGEDIPIWRSVYTWCPGCENAHPFHGAVHLCADEHPYGAPCPNPETCGQPGHLILDGDVRGHPSAHTRDPAWGDCHSFLRTGVWEFLGDSGHALAGQRVPMVPLPDWLAR